MKLDLGSQPIDITCPGCREKIGSVKRNSTLPCLGCRHPIRLDTHELRRSIDAIQKTLDQLGRARAKLSK